MSFRRAETNFVQFSDSRLGIDLTVKVDEVKDDLCLSLPDSRKVIRRDVGVLPIVRETQD